MQYQPRQQVQQNYYERQPQYYPAQPVGQQYRPVAQQYGVNYGQQPVAYSQYPAYQKSVPVSYQAPMAPGPELWQREATAMPVRPPEAVSMYAPPTSHAPRAEYKPAPARPAQPAVQPAKPIVQEKPQPELSFKFPSSTADLLHPAICPGSFDILGRGNLPSISFTTEFS